MTMTLAIEQVSAGYGRRRVMQDLSLPPIATGTVTALVGPNAAGKSTLLRAIAGLVPATGRIVLDDRDILRLPFSERARHLTFMPQSLPQGVGLTVLESVIGALAASPTGEAASHADMRLRAVGALERLDMLETAMESLDTLSGGQRQMAALAQAIVRDPKLLLLDEPTSALDLRHQEEVMRTARALADEGRIVVIVLHDLSLAARFADRVVVLDHGRVRSDGPAAEALTPGILAEVYKVEALVETAGNGRLRIDVLGPLVADEMKAFA